MKKLFCLLLVMALLLSTATALAEALEPVKFTTSCTNVSDTLDYYSDPLYKLFSEKFNFEYELFPTTGADANEKARIWINGGTMPDIVWMDSIIYTEYLDYADQGLIAPLPDGWETKYPNLYNMIQATAVADKYTVDGKLYCIPHATLYNFSPVDTPVSHLSLYYRADWVEALGLEPFGLTITVDQLREFLELAIEKDLAGNGKTIGAMGIKGEMFEPFVNFYNPAWLRFAKQEDGTYIWGPQVEGTVKGIEQAREWYQSGLINPDFYLLQRAESRNAFAAGLGAAMFDSGGITNVEWIMNSATQAGVVPDPYNNIKLTILVDDEGRWHGPVSTNYWSLHMFSPDIDEKTFDRILSMMDYICTEEGEITIALGLKGEDWDFDAEGKIELLRAPNEDGSITSTKALYPSWQFFYLLGVLPDDFSFVSPIYDQRVIDSVVALYKEKVENGVLLPVDYDYNFFSSDARAAYSVDIPSEIIRLMLAEKADVAAEWNAFIESNRAIWEPVMNDLNAAFAK